jgi:Uma2 family endonuclease
MMLIPKWAGGSTTIDDDDYVSGAPELVCEVAASSTSIDMHAKLRAYRRNGVKEYLVWRTIDRAVEWFELIDGTYVPMPADEKGRIRCKVFPGLWLDAAGLLAGDLAQVLAAVDEGTATEEHKSFVKLLNELAAQQASANG